MYLYLLELLRRSRPGAERRGDEDSPIPRSKGYSETLDPDVWAFLRYADGKAAVPTLTIIT